MLLSAALLVFICSWLPSSFVGMWFVVAIIYIALPFGLGGLLEYVLRVVLTRRQHLESFKMLIQRCNCTAFFLQVSVGVCAFAFLLFVANDSADWAAEFSVRRSRQKTHSIGQAEFWVHVLVFDLVLMCLPKI